MIMSSHAQIRFAETDDFDRLEEIETAADALLVDLFSAEDWPTTTPATERAAYPGFTLLLRRDDAGIIGFVQVLEIDGIAHMEQLSVDPRYGRRVGPAGPHDRHAPMMAGITRRATVGE